MEFHIGGRTGDSGSDIIFSDDDEGQDRCSGKDTAEGRHSRCMSSCSSCSNSSTDAAGAAFEDAKFNRPWASLLHLFKPMDEAELIAFVPADEQAEMKETIDEVFIPGEVCTGKACKALAQAFPDLCCGAELSTKMISLVGLGRRIRRVAPTKLKFFIEYCSGRGAITRSMLRLKLPSSAYDRKYDSSHDIVSDSGLWSWIASALFTSRHGALWFAPECKTWVWMNRNGNLRSSLDWRGDESLPEVAEANEKCIRVIIVLVLASLLDIQWLLEQPRSSLYNYVDFVVRALDVFDCDMISTYLGCFGAESEKPLKIFSTAPWGIYLQRERPLHKDFVKLVTNKVITNPETGLAEKKVTGRQKLLSDSEAYPEEFGREVADLFCKHLCDTGFLPP